MSILIYQEVMNYNLAAVFLLSFNILTTSSTKLVSSLAALERQNLTARFTARHT